MPLELNLAVGTVAVYGHGYPGRTPSGLQLEPSFRIGTIYNIWDGGATYVYGGDVVFWKDGSQITRVVTEQNETYTLLPARLVTKDFPPEL